MSRTYKKPYTGSKRFDRSCRSNKGCPACEGSRLYNDKRRRDAADKEIEDFLLTKEEEYWKKDLDNDED